MRKITFTILCCAMLIICANTEANTRRLNRRKPLPKEKVANAQSLSIKFGETTKEEITQFFGKPEIIRTIEGKECWFYESGDTQPWMKGEKYLIVFQFSKDDKVEDSYETNKASFKNLKLRDLEEVKQRNMRIDNRLRNQKKYGFPDSERELKDKILWFYQINEKSIGPNMVEREFRVLQFDKSFNFVKEYKDTGTAYVYKLSDQESKKMKAMMNNLGKELMDSLPKSKYYVVKPNGTV